MDGSLALQRFGQHEASLGQGALRGIDEQHDAVHHPERTFHFTAKVGVPRRVDDVDLDVTVTDGRVLGHDRDAFFTLEIHRVHDAILHGLMLPKRSALPQHGVDERGLAVIHVCDDGDIAKIHAVFVLVERKRRAPAPVPSSVVGPNLYCATSRRPLFLRCRSGCRVGWCETSARLFAYRRV